jgi:hypothetical protein
VDWIEDNSEGRRELVKRISSDCSWILEELHLKYPQFVALQPSRKVEDVLLDVCDFHVIDHPLPEGQVALCDFSCSTVFFNCNSQCPSWLDRPFFRLMTLTHELGHIRLHADEMEEEFRVTYHRDFDILVDPRSFQKEQEAELYACLFLMPMEMVLADQEVQQMLRNLKSRQAMSSRSLWRIIHGLASQFQVSPFLVKRCFLYFGWLREGRKPKKERQLQLHFRRH